MKNKCTKGNLIEKYKCMVLYITVILIISFSLSLIIHISDCKVFNEFSRRKKTHIILRMQKIITIFYDRIIYDEMKNCC